MEVIRVSIGTEPKQHIPCEVLKSSIRRRTSRRVEFTQSWTCGAGWHPALLGAPKLKQGTRFSAWRWLVPSVYGNQGEAIYLDADQLVLADIAELWATLDNGGCFAAVCDAVGFFGGTKKPEPGAVQTSVMAMHCKRCEWDPAVLFRRVHAGKLSYKDLMQARFIPRDRIQELPREWNHFSIRKPDTKLVHFSHVASQPYRNTGHPLCDLFAEELRASIEAGHVSREEVAEAVNQGHLHEVYL